MKRGVRGAAVLGLFLATLLVGPGAASAHPLGNFTINLYGGIVIEPGHVRVDYVLDMAEIPTFQEMRIIDSNGDGRAEAGELARYAHRKALRLRHGVAVTSGGRAVALRVTSSEARLRPGQGGLPILRLETAFEGGILPSGSVRYRDTNYAGRIGWREVTAVGASGEVLATSSVPRRSASEALLRYPKSLLSNPLHVTTASVSFRPGRSGASPGFPVDPAGGARPGIAGGSFARLATWSGLSIPVAVIALLLAAVFGAVHALLPGHGKTIMAAYLVGAGGRVRQAVQVGLAVALMHTASVLALGLAVLGLTAYAPERAYPWLTLASGLVVLALGSYLVWSRGLRRRHSHRHMEGPHDHDGSHTHSHQGEDRPLSRKGLAGLALAGGILPSPTAMLVLLSTVHQHRVGFGLALIASFSLGLAGALVVVGCVALRARRAVEHRLRGRVATLVPVVSAAVILAVGVVLVAHAAARL
jgi:nickel/cobalt transporter (NicO) family protein